MGFKVHYTMFGESAAVFSECERYRYKLWRTWNPKLPIVTFIMLNPSTADELENDPTVERCQRRAAEMQFGTLRVGNLFALRATNPREIFEAEDPIGPENDGALMELVDGAAMVIIAWGAYGMHLDRSRGVRGYLRRRGIEPFHLGKTAAGEPLHPLYIPYAVTPTPWLDPMMEERGHGSRL